MALLSDSQSSPPCVSSGLTLLYGTQGGTQLSPLPVLLSAAPLEAVLQTPLTGVKLTISSSWQKKDIKFCSSVPLTLALNYSSSASCVSLLCTSSDMLFFFNLLLRTGRIS